MKTYTFIEGEIQVNQENLIRYLDEHDFNELYNQMITGALEARENSDNMESFKEELQKSEKVFKKIERFHEIFFNQLKEEERNEWIKEEIYLKIFALFNGLVMNIQYYGEYERWNKMNERMIEEFESEGKYGFDEYYDQDEAIKEYTMALKMKGIYFATRGNGEEANKSFKKALEASDKIKDMNSRINETMVFLLSLAHVHRQEKQYVEANENYLKYIELFANHFQRFKKNDNNNNNNTNKDNTDDDKNDNNGSAENDDNGEPSGSVSGGKNKRKKNLKKKNANNIKNNNNNSNNIHGEETLSSRLLCDNPITPGDLRFFAELMENVAGTAELIYALSSNAVEYRKGEEGNDKDQQTAEQEKTLKNGFRVRLINVLSDIYNLDSSFKELAFRRNSNCFKYLILSLMDVGDVMEAFKWCSNAQNTENENVSLMEAFFVPKKKENRKYLDTVKYMNKIYHEYRKNNMMMGGREEEEE